MRKTSCYPFATPPTLATPPILSEDVTFGKTRLSTDSKGALQAALRFGSLPIANVTQTARLRPSTDSKERHTMTRQDSIL